MMKVMMVVKMMMKSQWVGNGEKRRKKIRKKY